MCQLPWGSSGSHRHIAPFLSSALARAHGDWPVSSGRRGLKLVLEEGGGGPAGALRPFAERGSPQEDEPREQTPRSDMWSTGGGLGQLPKHAAQTSYRREHDRLVAPGPATLSAGCCMHRTEAGGPVKQATSVRHQIAPMGDFGSRLSPLTLPHLSETLPVLPPCLFSVLQWVSDLHHVPRALLTFSRSFT